MEKFSILECDLLWNKHNKIPKNHKLAIKEELKTVSSEIEKAMEFIKSEVVEKRSPTVIYELNPEIKNSKYDFSYTLRIFADNNEWMVSVWSELPEMHVADIYNEKWKIITLILEEDIQKESLK